MVQRKKASESSEGSAPGMKIDYDEIGKLIALLEEKNLSQFELETGQFKIKIGRAVPQAPLPVISAPAPVPQVEEGGNPVPVPVMPREHDASWSLVKSPMVGTFYRAPDPSSDPFVEVGDSVKKGQVLCIIEAMKLMNEIESEIDGVVVEIFGENARPVEYGQKLFAVQPAS
jgi:acetyl-CoA carboxylase biotin carboxyl carrier protein